jgi:hypothetical protein
VLEIPSPEELKELAHDAGETEESVEEMFELYSHGFRDSEIAEITGADIAAVDWVLRAEGLDPFNNDY